MAVGTVEMRATRKAMKRIVVPVMVWEEVIAARTLASLLRQALVGIETSFRDITRTWSTIWPPTSRRCSSKERPKEGTDCSSDSNAAFRSRCLSTYV